MKKNEMTFRQIRAAMRKEMAKVISIDETKEVYVGGGVVDSEFHFDWFPVELTGTWFHDKVAKKWGYIRENETEWQWFGEDEVTVPAICWG